MRLGRHISRALAEVGLTPAQYRVLAFLAEGDALASKMAGDMEVTRPSVTALIDGLAERGLVRREAHPTDRRRRTLRITDAGRLALAGGDDVATLSLRNIGTHLDADDANDAIECLATWNHAVGCYHSERQRERQTT